MSSLPQPEQVNRLACTLNGKPLELAVAAERRLVDVLRKDLG